MTTRRLVVHVGRCRTVCHSEYEPCTRLLLTQCGVHAHAVVRRPAPCSSTRRISATLPTDTCFRPCVQHGHGHPTSLHIFQHPHRTATCVRPSTEVASFSLPCEPPGSKSRSDPLIISRYEAVMTNWVFAYSPVAIRSNMYLHAATSHQSTALVHSLSTTHTRMPLE